MTTTNPIDALLAEKGVLLADGATGTNLFAMGLEAGEAPELLNETAPATIATLHQNFVDAGADIILTNSFGGTRHRLKLHHAQDRVRELNKRAAEIARSVADKAGRKVIVAGSVGPTGELLVPLGALTYEDAVDAFAEQIEDAMSSANGRHVYAGIGQWRNPLESTIAKIQKARELGAQGTSLFSYASATKDGTTDEFLAELKTAVFQKPAAVPEMDWIKSK